MEGCPAAGIAGRATVRSLLEPLDRRRDVLHAGRSPPGRSPGARSRSISTPAAPPAAAARNPRCGYRPPRSRTAAPLRFRASFPPAQPDRPHRPQRLRLPSLRRLRFIGLVGFVAFRLRLGFIQSFRRGSGSSPGCRDPRPHRAAARPRARLPLLPSSIASSSALPSAQRGRVRSILPQRCVGASGIALSLGTCAGSANSCSGAIGDGHSQADSGVGSSYSGFGSVDGHGVALRCRWRLGARRFDRRRRRDTSPATRREESAADFGLSDSNDSAC